MNYSLYNDDCMNILPSIKDKSIECIITDLPYNSVNKKGSERAKYRGQIRKIDKGLADVLTFNITDFLHEITRVSNGSIFLFCGINQISEIYDYFENEKDFMVRLCVWHKSNPSPMNGQHMYLNSTEFIIYAKRRKTIFNGRCIHNVFEFPTTKSKIHPTEKPIALLQQMILDTTEEYDTVADFCGGSFSCGVASLELNRNFIGVEINKDFFEKAKKRLEESIK